LPLGRFRVRTGADRRRVTEAGRSGGARSVHSSEYARHAGPAREYAAARSAMLGFAPAYAIGTSVAY
jgi:hypothetical protein